MFRCWLTIWLRSVSARLMIRQLRPLYSLFYSLLRRVAYSTRIRRLQASWAEMNCVELSPVFS